MLKITCHFSNSNTLISVLFFFRLECLSRLQIYFYTVILEKWRLKAFKKCVFIYSNRIGQTCQLICKDFSLLWLQMHNGHFIIMDSDLPFWIWKLLLKWSKQLAPIIWCSKQLRPIKVKWQLVSFICFDTWKFQNLNIEMQQFSSKVNEYSVFTRTWIHPCMDLIHFCCVSVLKR